MTEPDTGTDEGRDPGRVDEEAVAAADGLHPKPDVAEHHQEMDRIGASAEGEGRIP